MSMPTAALMGLLGAGPASIGGYYGTKAMMKPGPEGEPSGFSKFLFGTPERDRQNPIYNPQQENILNQLLQQGGMNADFGGIENLARQRFQQETVPSLAERFTSMGAGGQGSSAFASSLGRAGSDLESQLAALRGQFGMQQLGMGMMPRMEREYNPAQPGMLQGGLQGLISLLPMLLGI